VEHVPWHEIWSKVLCGEAAHVPSYESQKALYKEAVHVPWYAPQLKMRFVMQQYGEAAFVPSYAVELETLQND